jgi:phosphoribosyl-dephospho-CoA transferase
MRCEVVPDVHTLLRIDSAAALGWDVDAPDWALQSLRRAPWVVVRRAPSRQDLLPVGVRGFARNERVAAWLPRTAIRECCTPRALAAARGWLRLRDVTPAIATLHQAEAILHAHGWSKHWGPGGSAGFELASGQPVTTIDSDLDLVIFADAPYGRTDAVALIDALTSLSVRCDVLMETPYGAVALAEYARGDDVLMQRTPHGPRLVQDPWIPAATVGSNA